MKHMFEVTEFRAAGQQFLAAAWELAHATTTAADDGAGVVEFLDVIEEVTAQLAGVRLNTIDQARLLACTARVHDAVISSPSNTVGKLRGHVRLATVLAEQLPLIGAALREGQVSLAQAEAIADGFGKLPATFGQDDLRLCQVEILEYVDDLGPNELRLLAVRLVELVDPDGAEAAEAARLAAEERRARRRRRLRLVPNHHGAMTISGSLPLAEGAHLAAQLEALMPPLTSYQNTGELPDRAARTADALLLLAQIAANSGHLPNQGKDRPHVVITLDHDTLASGLGRISLPGNGGRLGAGDARRLACDAGIIPVVLGGDSRPLDVGREARHFTKAIRTALTLRDQGCAFPGCTAVPAACDAHHIRPWWAGGASSLANALLVCPFHHRLVEPDPDQSERSQWRVHLDPATGLPWFTPPAHIDPARTPRQHRRHRLSQIKLEPDIPRQHCAPPPTPRSTPPPVRPRAPLPRIGLDNDWNRAQDGGIDPPPRLGTPPSRQPLPGQPGYINPWHQDDPVPDSPIGNVCHSHAWRPG